MKFTYHRWRAGVALHATIEGIRDFVWEMYYWDLRTLNNAKPYFLVELALAERDSKNAVVSFSLSVGPSLHTFLAKIMETGDKNCGDFHCMQMSLMMSMQYIFGDD